MRRARRPVGGLAALTLVALAGCALVRATPQIRYYTLALPDEPPRLAAPLGVGAFSADLPYATERIAYRSSPYRLDYYTYHRWAADPRTIVRTAARDYLERAAAGAGPPLVLEGHIRRMEEVDEPGGWYAALTLELTVRRGGTPVLARTYAETEPARAQNPEAVAAALSRALERMLDRLAGELPAGGREGAPAGRE